ncbi:MAG TPA: S-adenosylmethionine:tRNA ribosyltransferase-isomerase [Anaeromyxobacter sp.]
MTAASGPRGAAGEERLLAVDAGMAAIEELRLVELPRLLEPGDLLVVNDAATLPASLMGAARGEALEVRLLSEHDDGAWEAVLLGAGDWRTPTERRPPPPVLRAGERLFLAGGLEAAVERVSPLSPRLATLRFEGPRDALIAALYAAGRPVQYAHLRAPLELRDVQTPFAARPWAAEMPSAGRPLTWDLLSRLRRRGVAIAALTHAAGLSATGDPALDAALPLPERFEIPAATASAVGAARRRGARVVAVGTTVVRALEGSASENGGRVSAGRETTDLRLGPESHRRAVDAILTGIHEPGTSHHALLGAFAPRALLDRALALAEERGFLGHEFGDAMWIAGAPAPSSGGFSRRNEPRGRRGIGTPRRPSTVS